RGTGDGETQAVKERAMRTMLLIGLVSVGLGLTAGSLFGDVPPFGGGKRPERDDPLAPPVPQIAALPPPNATHLTIVVSKDVTKPRLEIPGPVLEKCAPKGEKVGENRNLRLPVAGSLVFALALAGGALFLVRGRTRWAATAMLLAVGVALSSGHS